MTRDNMLTIKPVAYPGAHETVLAKGMYTFTTQFPHIHFERDQRSAEVLLFITGGSEHQALANLDPNQHYLLCASIHDNAFAAAAEVAAYLNQAGIKHKLLQYSGSGHENTIHYLDAMRSIKAMKGKRLGLIGNASPWLVASNADAATVHQVFGIDVQHIDWESLPPREAYTPDEAFYDHFSLDRHNEEANRSAQVYSQLRALLATHQLDALSVDCFPMADKEKVTACLALSMLNDTGTATACEGDVISAIGMMICQSIAAEPVWMANLSGAEDDRVAFAHCTVPKRMTTETSLDSHFETQCSLAIHGEMKPGSYTIFRLQQDLKRYMLISGRKTIGIKSLNSCRTQLWLEMPEHERQALINNPLGNHHIIVHGHHAPAIEALMTLLGIKKA